MEAQRQHLLSKIDDQKIRGYLQEIDCASFQRNIEGELFELNKLSIRFKRPTINIGVVGLAGQGKSHLLRSLTGLPEEVIPSGDRQHCTGVRSRIEHDSYLESYEIYFHSESSFLKEIIAPYYDKEELNLGSPPITLDEFAKKSFDTLPTHLKNQAELGAMYERLRLYHANLDKYRPRFKEPSPKYISREKVREYVAQETKDGERIYFNYLAVQEAVIKCTFPNPDVGKIAVIDMVGLGDTGLANDEQLIEKLGKDVDIILFVRMPVAPRGNWLHSDVQLYDKLAKALRDDLPIKLWSFLILNRTEDIVKLGDNSVYCQMLADTLIENNLQFVECIIANCDKPEEVNSKILDRVLDYLVQKNNDNISNIAALDRQYALARQDSLNHLQNKIDIELEKARLALNLVPVKDNWFEEFERLFDNLWTDLTTGLEDLLRELLYQRDAADIDFQEQVNILIQVCKEDTGIPSEAEVESQRNRLGGYPEAFYHYLKEIRAHLSKHFLLLDESLKKGIEEVKSQVAEVLSEQGRLENLAEVHGADFLKVIAELIPERLSELKFGFQILADFTLAYRGMIQHRIRKRLDNLTSDKTSHPLSTNSSAKEVKDCLEVSLEEAIFECENALDELLAEPSQAAFAIVEEFCDRVLRAKGVKSEWRIFLQEIREDIWPTEFEKLGEQSRDRQEWLDAIEKVNLANQLNNLKFLN